jgi:uncharacterized SAM-binding protein YcdF (DUF218 family)
MIKIIRILCITLFAALAFGFFWFCDTIPRQVDDSTTVSDAIIVLTGGGRRVEEGLGLYKNGMAKYLYVSGVHENVTKQDLFTDQGLTGLELECCILLDTVATNTQGNARQTAVWMRENRIHSIRLVTADFHLRRSLLEFRRVMPSAKIIPHPVVTIKNRDWWRSSATFQALGLEYIKYLRSLAGHRRP